METTGLLNLDTNTQARSHLERLLSDKDLLAWLAEEGRGYLSQFVCRPRPARSETQRPGAATPVVSLHPGPSDVIVPSLGLINHRGMPAMVWAALWAERQMDSRISGEVGNQRDGANGEG